VILVCGSCMEREKASGETGRPGRMACGSREGECRGRNRGIEYRSRRLLADRPVLAEKPLLAGVAVERRGRLTGNVIRSTGAARRWEEAKLNMPKSKDKPFAIPCVLKTVFDLPVGVRPQ